MWQCYFKISRPGWLLPILFLLWNSNPGYSQRNPTRASIPQLRYDLETATTDSNRAWIANKLSISYCVTSHDSAIYFALLSIKLAQKLPDKHLFVQAYRQLGQAYDCIGQTAKSLDILAKAGRISKQLYNDSTTAIINEAIAFTYTSQGDNDKAITKYIEALQYYEGHTMYRYISRANNGLGVCHLDTKNYNQALLYLDKAKIAAQLIQDTTMLLFALNNTAFALFNLNQNQKAETVARQALAIGHSYKDNWHIIGNLIILGYVMNKAGRFQRAIVYSSQGLVLQKQVGDKSQLSRLNSNLADAYMGLKQYTKASTYADRAVTILRTITYNEVLKNALFVQARALEKNHRYKRALATFKEAQFLEDSLTGLEKIKQVSRIQSSYDLQRKQDLINQQQQQLLFARQRQLLYLVILFLLTGLLALIGFQLRRQQAAKRLLSKQKEEIHLQAQQLTDLNATKDKLFSIISHDLRSPVARLKQNFYQLRAHSQLTSMLLKPIAQLEEQVDQVLNLLTNLLDWSHSQLTGFQSHPQRIELIDAIADSISQLADHLQQKNIRVLNQIPAQMAVMTDKHQLNSILRNVLSNAVKFTPEGGYIRLQAVVKADQIELIIQDTGIGMNSEELACLLTDPLVRLGTQGELSTGLGLRLSRELLDQQGGSLAITSQPQKGTTVRIRLPKAPLDQAAGSLPSKGTGSYFADSNRATGAETAGL